MPKYTGYVTVAQYRSFEFEADDEELAWDHMETLLLNHDEDYILNHWDESGETQVLLDDVGTRICEGF